MEISGHLSGGGPVLKRFLVSADVPNAGVPMIGTDTTGTDAGGIQIISNTPTAEPIVGLAVDTNGTYPADPDAQVNADVDVFVTVSCRPDAIFRAKMTSGSAEDTALTVASTTTASATGDTIVAGTAWIDHASVWGYTGANVGALPRKADTTLTVGVSFPNAIGAGDEFLFAAGFPGYVDVAGTVGVFMDLSALLTQADANTVDSNNDNFWILDIEANDEGGSGRTNSYYHLIPFAHLFGSSVTRTVLS